MIIIPARMASLRLPGKPLADICGKSMIVHVMERAEEADIGKVYIACAEEEIAEAIVNAGGNAIMTRADHPSGTDRIFEALGKIDPHGEEDIIINLQGDLPTIDPNVIKEILLPFKNPDVDISTMVAEITDDSERDNPNVVKVAIAWHKDNKTGKALYFSRSTIPYKSETLYHHIGIYAYRRKALETFTALKPSPLEKIERLEQLRALENNLRIDVVHVNTVPFGVDTPEDLEKAKSIIGVYSISS